MTAHQAPALLITDLKLTWANHSQPVLDIPKLEIKTGERVFIKGPSGCGKTTLLNVMSGALEPDHGDVSLLGHPLYGLSGAKRDLLRSHHIGFVFQMFNLLPYLSLLENVMLPCGFSKIRTQKAQSRGLTLEQEARRLLAQLGLDVHELSRTSVNRLSVGQQQRVALARALMGSPDIVIADEPTSALDASLRSAFMGLLMEQVSHSEATLIFVSHDSDLEPFFERTVDLPALNRSPEGCKSP